MVKSLRNILLCFIFILAATTTLWATEPTLEINILTQETDQGIIEVIVSVTNNPGIAGYDLHLAFDNTVLTPISIAEGEALSGMVFSSNVMGATEERIGELNAVTAVWGAAADNVGTGTIFTVLFRIAPDATGITELSLTSRGIGNAEGQTVDFVPTGAAIDVGGNGDAIAPISDEVPADGTGGGIATMTWVIIALAAVVTALVAVIIVIIKKRNQMPKQTSSPNSRYRGRELDARRRY